jgi:hypothetical protein
MNRYVASGIVSALILIGCDSSEDRVRKAVETYQELNMNDYKSYEFVSLTLDSNITHSQNIEWWLSLNREEIARNEEGLKEDEDFLKFLSSPIYYSRAHDELIELTKQNISRKKVNIESVNSHSVKLDSLRESMGDKINTTACIVYSYSYREKNELGAVVLRRTKLFITPDLRVVHIAIDEDSKPGPCNSLPEIQGLFE